MMFILDDTLRELAASRVIQRIWSKDSTIWRRPDQDSREIIDRLGWLAAPTTMKPHVAGIRAFVHNLREEGFTHAVLLGMGGSSLAPYVLARAFGRAEGFLSLYMLDSTAPGAIEHCEAQIDLAHTLFIVASKSGGTIETLSMYKYFWERVGAIADKPGRQFIAITDPGSGLEDLARKQGFRTVFLNPTDIGGRYSALSLFGLVPAALIGMDITRLLRSGEAMVARCGVDRPIRENPGAVLGAFMGAMVRQGRDKLVITASPPIGDFGLWAEQLIAESTGKEGKGIIPVIAHSEQSPLTSPGADRALVHLRMGTRATPRAANEHGLPVFTRSLKDVYALGGEMFCWEMATTVAGHLLGIHPFDQPNVAQAKRATAEVLAEFKRTGGLPQIRADWEGSGVSLGGIGAPVSSLADGMATFFSRVREGDYCAVLAYISPDGTWEPSLQSLQEAIAARTRAAVTIGYGPRYLHSTGQLHKGGPNTGHFIILTAHDKQDRKIPGEQYTFGTLKTAQALGDMQALQATQRHVIRVHAGENLKAAMTMLHNAIQPQDA